MSELEIKYGLICPQCTGRKEWKVDLSSEPARIQGENGTAMVVSKSGNMTERCYFHNKKAQGLFNTEKYYEELRVERLDKMKKERRM